MAQLKRLTVRGYKSIYELKDFDLRSLNVLIGANGAGKSNFINLFRMLAAIADQRLQLFVQSQDGPDSLLFGTRTRTRNIEVKVEFEGNGYEISLVESGDRLIFARENVLTVSDYHHNTFAIGTGQVETNLPDQAQGPFMPYARKAIAGWRAYHFPNTSRSALIRQKHRVGDNLILRSDAENLAPFLRRLREQHPEYHDRIVRTIQQVAPFFDDFVYRKDAERVELEWIAVGDPDMVFSARQLSDGTLRFIALATLLLQPAELQPDTILIDEPELGLHPYALAVVASLLQQAAETRQLIIATQSVELVNEMRPEDVVVVNRDDGASNFKRLDEQELADWLKDYGLGELWERNILGGGPAR